MTGIRIKGLFGYFDYDIDLADGGITILTGPNGYGKSTIIRCVNALRNSDVEFFQELDFKNIEIVGKRFEENLLIEKLQEELIFNGRLRISKESTLLWKKGIRYRRDSERLELFTGEQAKIAMAYKMYDSYKEVLELMQASVGEVECIAEQRLIRVDERRTMRTVDERRSADRKVINVVDEIPDKLLAEMRRVANQYSRVANELDSTYPERLFEQSQDMSKDEFEADLIAMQEKVEKLNKYGISNISRLKHVEFQA